LFNVGKITIGWYIDTQGLKSTHRAAASVVILLIWVYYSAQIVLFGPELTRAYALESSSRSTVGARTTPCSFKKSERIQGRRVLPATVQFKEKNHGAKFAI
jgi:uncharacterized BrkB/YihY/UPF0761 family membrane protein